MTKAKINWKLNEDNKQKFVNKHKYHLLCKYLLIAIVITIFQLPFIYLFNQFFNINRNDEKDFHLLFSNKNINRGEKISDSDFSIVSLNSEKMKNYFLSNEDFEKFQNNITNRLILKDSPILMSDIMESNDNSTVKEKIPQGKRLYTLEVPLGSFQNLLKKGDLVDVIAHLDMPGVGPATENILEGVKVVNIGNNFENSEESSDSNQLTFFLTPEEIKIITFMKPFASFSLSIVNPNEIKSSQNNEPVTFNKFIQNERIQKIINSDNFRIINGSKLK